MLLAKRFHQNYQAVLAAVSINGLSFTFVRWSVAVKGEISLFISIHFLTSCNWQLAIVSKIFKADIAKF